MTLFTVERGIPNVLDKLDTFPFVLCDFMMRFRTSMLNSFPLRPILKRRCLQFNFDSRRKKYACIRHQLMLNDTDVKKKKGKSMVYL